jgi:octaprenyl-diphosphate synthase
MANLLKSLASMEISVIENEEIINGVNDQISAVLGDELPILTQLKNYVIESGGKRVRSIVATYIGEIFKASVEDSFKISAIVEIIHAASLLHDDVLDDANIRRGKPSGKKIFGTKEVILGGDYMFATAIRSLNDYENPGLMDIFTRVIRDLSIGELYQLEYEGSADISLDVYLKIIYAKTGSLFQTACEAMAIHTGKPEKEIMLMADLGKKLGLLFQIRDDYLDYFNGDLLLKKPYQDFENGLFTYPILIVRDIMKEDDKNKLLNYFASSRTERKRPETIQEFLRFIESYNAKNICRENMKKMETELLENIAGLPQHDFRTRIENQILKLMKLD